MFSTRNSRPATRGLTLVEMLISMAVTLVMMAAVVNLFANVGAGVRNRRASMELGSQLRLTRARLFKDLAGATSAARPKLPSDDHDDGYLEIIEGQWSDKNPSGLMDGDTTNGELDYATSFIPGGADPQLVIDYDTTDPYARVAETNDITNGGGLGDFDDILALTVRSESEPFVGRWINPTTGDFETIESDLAEVIWFVVENPDDGSLGEPGMRTLFRRVLLIAPWLTLPALNDVPGVTVAMSNDEKILTYYRKYDVSAQVYQVNSDGSLTVDPTAVVVPNTLSDLTKRENRFAHRWNSTWTAANWPYQLDQRVIREFPYDADTHTPPPVKVSPLRPFGRPFETTVATNDLDRQGEDVMLNDALAFDLRVYDPGAPLHEFNDKVLEPADAGWEAAVTAGAPIYGFGAYVNLGWDYRFAYTPPVGLPIPFFEEIHHPGWHPSDPTGVGFGAGNYATYDTWPYHYESDGIDQDGDGVDLDGDGDFDSGVDEGTDGLDSPTDSNGIVDDALERETAPPYDVALRGIQVKLRIYDRDTRQIREATVTRSFVPQ